MAHSNLTDIFAPICCDPLEAGNLRTVDDLFILIKETLPSCRFQVGLNKYFGHFHEGQPKFRHPEKRFFADFYNNGVTVYIYGSSVIDVLLKCLERAESIKSSQKINL